MKEKKNKKMRFSSKSRYFLTLVALTGLVGNPLLQGTTVLADSFLPDTTLVTADETQLPDVLNPEVPEIPEVQETEDTTEENESGQTEDEDETVKAPTSEEQPVPPVSEDKPKEAVSKGSDAERLDWEEWNGVWGGVNGKFYPDSGTLLLFEGTILDPAYFTWAGASEAWKVRHIQFEPGVEVPEWLMNFNHLFKGLSPKSIIGLGDLDTSSVNDMSYMFANLPELEFLDISGLDTSSVMDMAGMFIGAPLDNVDFSSFNTSKVTDMSYMFAHSRIFNSGGIPSFTLDLSSFDTNEVTNMSDMFRNMHWDWSLEEGKLEISSFNTSQVNDMSRMFSDINFLSHLNVSNFDTSSVTNMVHMFKNMQSLSELNVSNFNTSKVTNMSGMFSNMESLEYLDVSSFDTSSVMTMSEMFANVWRLRELNVSKFNTSQVIDMSGMFSGMSFLESLDLSSFDTGEVVDMSRMFGNNWWGWGGPSELDLSMFDTRKVTNMQHMFANMTNLERVNLSSFDTSSVAQGGMNFMFNNSNSLRELTLGPAIQSMAGTSLMPITPNTDFTGNWRNVGTGTVERPNGSHIWTSSELQNTFNGTQADTFVWQPNVPMILGQVEYSYDEPTKTLTLKGGTITNPAAWGNVPRGEVEHIVFTGNVNVGGNRSLFNLFGEMRVLETIDNLSYLDTRDVTNMASMFRGAGGETDNSRLKELDLSSFDTSSVTNMAMMFHAAIALTELDVSSFDTSAVRDMGDMFSHASSLQEIKGLDSFETGAVTDMQGMFRNTAVSDLDLSSFDTRQVTDMNAMFAESRNLEKIDLSTFDTQQVTDMGMMFMHTQSIDKLDLSHFKTENVRDMNHMFAGARDLEELLLDKDNFDTSSVTDMFRMFAHTHNLKSLDLRGFDTRAVTNMEEMFWLADALTELDLSSFETPALTRMEAMFDGASALRKIDMSSFDTRNVQANNRTRLFSAINALDELRLGANTVITNSDLPTETTSTGLLNSWKRETQGLEAFTGPNTLFDFSTGPIIGNNVLRGPADWLSSQDLMTLSGTAGEATGTWRRVPYQTNVQVKDSSVFIGEDWQPEDNFVSATDREGNNVPLSSITVEGTVDTDTAGTYKVTYTYDGVSATAEITVKESQTSVQVKDSSLFVGEAWTAQDNFVSATDRYGESVPFNRIAVEGTVDTDTAGTYKVTYTYDGVSATAEIKVKESQTSVQVKDSSLFVGEAWNAQDNFVSATDRYGETVDFDRITVEGTVDTARAGTYKVTYTYDGVEETAQITVKAKGGGDDNGTSSGGGSGNDGSESNNGNGEYGTDTSDEDKDNEEQIASDNKEEELTPTHTDNLPRTGEIVGLLSILGLANLILALTLWLKRRKVK
ncbi:BspA family leucine-rich repeat surface protein [Lactococcus petauri]|uniref:BspA family leucine-rich repeat surface protein n=1 Tax=Lactococcus petauri TaxID=1940789 RepID=UPI001F59EA09|nr:BspA family leucine-rich repeat surface protein [Lactococcus petauri]